MKEEKNVILMAKKLPILTLLCPMKKRRAGKQNLPRFYPGKTSAAFPGISILRDSHIVLSKRP